MSAKTASPAHFGRLISYLTFAVLCPAASSAQLHLIPDEVIDRSIPGYMESRSRQNRSHVILRYRSGMGDTAEKFSYRYDSVLRRVTTERISYTTPGDFANDDSAAYFFRTRQGNLVRSIYDFDRNDRLIRREESALCAAGSYPAFLMACEHIVFRDIDSGKAPLFADDSAGRAAYRAYLETPLRRRPIGDSLLRNGIPEISTRTELHYYEYDGAGNLFRSVDSMHHRRIEPGETRFVITTQDSGRSVLIRAQYHALLEDNRIWYGVEQSKVSFTETRQTSGYTVHRSERDSINVVSASNLRVGKYFRYNAVGLPDSILIQSGGSIDARFDTHIYTYRDTRCTGITVLTQGSARRVRLDTVSQTTIRYDGPRKTEELTRTFSKLGGPFAYTLIRYRYDAAGSLRQAMTYSRSHMAGPSDSLLLAQDDRYFFDEGEPSTDFTPANGPAAAAPPPLMPGSGSWFRSGAVSWKPDQQAQFPGGPDSLKRYLRQEMKRLTIAGRYGVATVRATISQYGQIYDQELVRSTFPAESAALLESIVRHMPDWVPARTKSRPVPAFVTIQLTALPAPR